MPDPDFSKFAKNQNSPAVGAFPIVPSDTVDLPFKIRGVTIGGAGTIRYANLDGEICNTNTLAPGDKDFFATRIYATGTTATGMTGWR